VAYSVSPHFSSQVLKYSSVPDRWGIIYLLLEIQRFEIGQQFFTDMKATYRLNGRFIVPAITGLVGSMVLFVPVGSLRHLAAIIACLFVILAPGWGIHFCYCHRRSLVSDMRCLGAHLPPACMVGF
jgi:hypothetical protein